MSILELIKLPFSAFPPTS